MKNSTTPYTYHFLEELLMGIWIIFGHLRGNLSSMFTVSFWDDDVIDVSVEVVGDVGMDGVSERIGALWSGVWLWRDLYKDSHTEPFSTNGSTVII